MTDMTMCEMRREAAGRRRRVIFNNDGCDVWMHDGIPTGEHLLAQRTVPLVGTHVDTIAYCPIHSGFAQTSHNTKVGSLYTGKHGSRAKNMTAELIAQGTDVLQVNVEFAHAHGLESFASLRMNDTHDGWAGWDSPLLSPLKRDHPEWLLGTPDSPPAFGRWSAVNFALAPVRTLAFALIEELCTGYDIDGIELDFLRHETYFPSTAAGETCTDEERALMTGLLCRVRAMADEVARRRGRPLLISARVEDSIALSRDLGLDIERWLEDDLVDLVAASDYFRMAPWREMAALCAAHGVPFYPCLSDARVRDAEGRALRESLECCRGRAMNAYRAGAAGVELFNLFDPHHPALRELGDPAALATRDKVYFASVSGLGGAHWRVPNPQRYRQLPILSPEPETHCTLPLSAERICVPVEVGDDTTHGPLPEVTLKLRIAGTRRADDLHVWLNDAELTGGRFEDNLLCFRLAPPQVRLGNNGVAVAVWPGATTAPVLEDIQVHVRY